MNVTFRRALGVLPAILIVVASGRTAAAQDLPLTIDAVAVDLGSSSASTATTPVTIHIDRWSTDAERGQLRDALVEKGEGALLTALQKVKPEVGRISTPGSLGWQIRYATMTPTATGGKRIVFATDRYMSFAERTGGGRSRNYEYMLAEIRVGADGKGEGKLVPRANISYDKDNRTITIENYDIQPVRLNNVRVETGK